MLQLEDDPSKLDETVSVLRKRVEVAEDRHTTVKPLGPDRIEVLAPGISDPSGISRFLTRPGVLTFNLVDDEADASEWQPLVERDGRTALPDDSSDGQLAVVFQEAVVTGNDVVEASQIFDQITGQPSISFTLGPEGAARFGAATRDNIGRRFAIVLDSRIVSAPVIHSPIMEGRGQITGVFGREEARQIALMLRAGALPTRLTVIESSTFGEAPQ